MAATTTPKPNADFPSLDAVQHLRVFAVALSGGADSTALLWACAKRWPVRVHAIHVHHGLQAAADGFQAHCVQLCAELQVPLAVVHVNAKHATGESPEEMARKARYAAFHNVLQTHWQGQVKDVLLAQHADDQVETLLLALSRGAGLPGLASMPAQTEREGVRYHRPWLHVQKQQLRDALHAVGQAWVEDPSNTDVRYTRNRIRAQLLPALEAAFPSFRQTFVRSAAHAAQAQGLLQALAEQDLQHVGHPPNIQALQVLSEARQANALRHWLMLEKFSASTAQLQALLLQVQACTTRGHGIDIRVGRGFVRRDGAVLRCYNL